MHRRDDVGASVVFEGDALGAMLGLLVGDNVGLDGDRVGTLVGLQVSFQSKNPDAFLLWLNRRAGDCVGLNDGLKLGANVGRTL